MVAKKHWKDYSDARNEMLLKTNFKHSPWYIVNAEDKDDAHIALISHFLNRMKYPNKDAKLLSHEYDLVYSASDEDIKEKLY